MRYAILLAVLLMGCQESRAWCVDVDGVRDTVVAEYAVTVPPKGERRGYVALGDYIGAFSDPVRRAVFPFDSVAVAQPCRALTPEGE